MARNFGICDVSFGSLKGRGPARCLIGATVLLLVGIMGCSELAVSRIASKAQDDCQDCGPANGPTSRQDADQKTSDIIKKDLSPDRFEVVTTTTQNLFSQNQVLTFTSPNRKIHLQFALRDRGTLHLAPVFFAFNQSSAEPLFSSYLGLNFTQTQLRSNFTIDSVRESEIREHFRLPIGRISRVDDSFREIHIVLRFEFIMMRLRSAVR